MHGREPWRARSNLARAERRGQGVEEARAALSAVKAGLQEARSPECITAPTTARKMPSAEHLEMEIGLRGHVPTERFGNDPAAGMLFVLCMHFGGLHREIEMQEIFAPKQND